MSSWLAGALAPEWTLDDLGAALETAYGALFEDEDGAAVGLAVVLLDTPEPSSAAVPFIGVDPARRFRGLGGEAGLVLERHLRERLGVQKVYAPVPDGHGLAVYFWLRLGYRPLSSAGAPGPLLGLSADPKPGIWMLRDRP
jgi:GNAT superfamily N-acetyltransferase